MNDEAKSINLHSTEIKIRDFKAKEKVLLKAELLTLSKTIGVKIAPSKEEIDMLSELVCNQFKSLSIEEIKFAVELCLASKLIGNDKKIIDPNHYQSFNGAYLGTILNSYQNFRNKSLEQKRRNEERERLKNEISEREKNYPEYCKNMYEGFKNYIEANNVAPFAWDWDAVYIHMETIGMIELPNEEKKEFAEKIKKQLIYQADIQRLKTNDKSEYDKAIREIGSPSFRTECRKQYLKEFFEI